MARLSKNSVVHLLPKSAQKWRPEHWFSTYIGARQVMVFWADLDGYYGCADAIGTRQAYILIDRSCKAHSRTRLLDTVIHEMTHVVELAYFQHTKVEFGWQQYSEGQECSVSVTAVGTGLSQALANMTKPGKTQQELWEEIGLR